MSIRLTQHALGRLRARWDVQSWPTRSLLRHVNKEAQRALRTGQAVNTPAGKYLFFSLLGEDGYLVMHQQDIVTVLPRELCPEVNEILEEKNARNA